MGRNQCPWSMGLGAGVQERCSHHDREKEAGLRDSEGIRRGQRGAGSSRSHPSHSPAALPTAQSLDLTPSAASGRKHRRLTTCTPSRIEVFFFLI